MYHFFYFLELCAVVFWAISRQKAWEGALNNGFLNSQEFIWLPLDGQCPAQHGRAPMCPKKGGGHQCAKGQSTRFSAVPEPTISGDAAPNLPCPRLLGRLLAPIWVSSASPPCPDIWLPEQPDRAVTAIDPFNWLHPQAERWKEMCQVAARGRGQVPAPCDKITLS